MAEQVASITTLIRDRALCLRCIAQGASMNEEAADTALAVIMRALKIDRDDHRKCEGCGEISVVFRVGAWT